MKGMLSRVKEELFKNKRFIIVVHDNPDGDTLGSAAALVFILRKLRKDVRVLKPDRINSNYQFLVEMIKKNLVDTLEGFFDAMITVDIAGWDQTSQVEKYVDRFKKIINIDHHADNRKFGSVNWVNTKASAVGEMIYHLVKKCRIRIDKNIATVLYTAITTDTGSFRFSNTTSTTHRIVADLIDCGANTKLVINTLYENIPVDKFKLFAKAIRTAKLSDDGEIIWMWITKRMANVCKSEIENTEGFIDMVKRVKGVKVAVLFKEADDKNMIRVTFRSKDPKVMVNEIAKIFGGGGHPAAAGCSVSGNKLDVERKVLEVVRQFLRARKKRR